MALTIEAEDNILYHKQRWGHEYEPRYIKRSARGRAKKPYIARECRVCSNVRIAAKRKGETQLRWFHFYLKALAYQQPGAFDNGN